MVLLLILIHSSEVDGKLSENSFAWEQKTVGKFRFFRNIPSSSSELVGLIWSSCRKSFPSPWQVSLLHPVRLAEFSVNFFYSVQYLAISFFCNCSMLTSGSARREWEKYAVHAVDSTSLDEFMWSFAEESNQIITKHWKTHKRIMQIQVEQ